MPQDKGKGEKTMKKAKYYVTEIKGYDEFVLLKTEDLGEAIEFARDMDYRKDKGSIVEIRVYKEDIEDENCTNFDYELIEYRVWYAVQENSTDAWDKGTFDEKEAIEMLREQGRGLIAVIDRDVCIREIEFSEVEER